VSFIVPFQPLAANVAAVGCRADAERLRYPESVGAPIMTVTLDLPPEKEAAFKAEARARGLSLEQWMLEAADRQVQPVSIAHLQKTNPEEWARQFREWSDSHDPNIPVLSDEAMSRESIYSDLI
jgi:hypothetical protein